MNNKNNKSGGKTSAVQERTKLLVAIAAICVICCIVTVGATVMLISPKLPEVAADTTPATTLIPMTIQGVPLTLNTTVDQQVYEPAMLTSEFPMDFSMGEYQGWDITIQDTSVVSGQTTQIQIAELGKDVLVPIVLTNKNTGKQVTQYIRTLPSAVRDYIVISHVSDGVYYYAHNGYVYKVDHAGNTIFYYRDTTSTKNYINEFKKTEIEGKTYYLITSYLSSHEYPEIGNGSGPNAKGIILDENYYQVDVVDALYETDRTPAGIPLDQHEFRMLGEDHYLLCGYVPLRVNNIPDDVEHSQFGARVVASVIQEVKNGEVIFEWYSTDHPELYALSVEPAGNDFFNATLEWSDYAHLNSIDIDPLDGSYICSFRNLDSLMKIGRDGEIKWILSGLGDQFGLTEDQKTSRQHDLRKVGEHTYSAYDNGNKNSQTRIVEYTLNDEETELVDFKEYYLEKIFSPAQGNAQKIEGTDARYVMSGGMWTTSGNAFFWDVDFETGEILFEAVPTAVTDANYDMVYRAYRFDS